MELPPQDEEYLAKAWAQSVLAVTLAQAQQEHGLDPDMSETLVMLFGRNIEEIR